MLAQRIGNKELERIAELGKNSLARYISGETTPKADVVARMATATGCDPGWLLTGEGEPYPTATGTPATAAAIEAALASIIRLAHHAAEAVTALEPYVGEQALQSQIPAAEIRTAARALRDAGGQLLGIAGREGDE